MGLEIERKYLVKGDFSAEVESSKRIVQGYISSVPGRTVRVRIRDREAFLTIKGASVDNGLSRYEFEQSIPLADAEELLKLCEPGVIEKVRHYIPSGNHTWEVDVFHGENEGLVMAEIELQSPDEMFVLPDWIGEEVTGDRRYYNSMLTKNPYKNWGDETFFVRRSEGAPITGLRKIDPQRG